MANSQVNAMIDGSSQDAVIGRGARRPRRPAKPVRHTDDRAQGRDTPIPARHAVAPRHRRTAPQARRHGRTAPIPITVSTTENRAADSAPAAAAPPWEYSTVDNHNTGSTYSKRS